MEVKHKRQSVTDTQISSSRCNYFYDNSACTVQGYKYRCYRYMYAKGKTVSCK